MTQRRSLSILTAGIALFIMLSMLVGCGVSAFGGNEAVSDGIRKLDGIKVDASQYYSGTAIQKLPASVKDTDEISVIVTMERDALLDLYERTDKSVSFADFAASDEAEALRTEIAKEKEALLRSLREDGVTYTLGADYATALCGFEIVIAAGDFLTTCQSLGDGVTPIVGEVYKAAETQLVENEVNVYETGIFDSSAFKYDGSGMVVAVLDTGTDHTHTAFSTKNFSSKTLGMTKQSIAAVLSDTRASVLHSGLTVEDVYYSDKLPYNFDYADFDPDVTPYQNHHGTHVAGVIAGKDDTITGVAPGAQIVTMKIFSDLETSARTSWILAALEDCVVLGVDVINMSIGTSCGFSREMDREMVGGVYDKIRDAGIAMVVAASNSYTSTYGSEKNGNLGLTSNPDTATVGSPSTYDGTLSVASIQGVKTPYLLYNGQIIYFTESTDRFSEEKKFFDELLGSSTDVMELEYVTIPGVGRSADYNGIDVKGKIALVARGSNTFEEKALIAIQKGAIALIVYNNVAGDIKMNAGEAELPICSISQDNGKLLAASAGGTISIAKSQTSGPFMSDFSSWGPTPDLGIKPEITAHGGSILSAMPGQTYDRLSGTSMACPNISGVTLLMQQYVKGSSAFSSIKDDKGEVTAMVNRLLMSTADIVFNTNGLPYAVRKQGAGLANLTSASTTTAYILTYDREDGSVMDKSKIELGDDPKKTGVYTLNFSVVNFGTSALSYELGAFVMTEGVAETKTHAGETTVDEQGHLLSGAKVEITTISGATKDGMTVSIPAGKTASITVTITLSDDDKKYLDESFENGYYVEGFITLDAKAGTEIDLSVPYLAFYGDWTVAPMFDIDYFETNKDELDDAIDLLDKTLPDAYATRPIGGLSDDYVSYLGSFYFQQDPSKDKIAADRKYISLSNQSDTINSLRSVWGGLLRGAATIDITITDDATGEIIFQKTDKDVRKSYGDGGSIYPADIQIEFSAIEHNLKNNSSYTVKLVGALDYGDGGLDTNLSNTFEFPLVADFEAPAVTDCEFYTEYDRSAKKTRLYAKISVYDNHYSMASQLGYVTEGTEQYEFKVFNSYVTPINSDFNGTTEVVYELTDYLDRIIEATRRGEKPSIALAVYDYALNQATYEIPLPHDFTDFYFGESEIVLSPYETFTLTPLVYPSTEWAELLTYRSTKTSVVKVIGNELVAVGSGRASIEISDGNGNYQYVSIRVLSEGDEGYVRYDKPVAKDFRLTGYYVNKAFYQLSSDDRDIGMTGDEIMIEGGYLSLSMFPSESVSLLYQLTAYFPEDIEVIFTSSNEKIVSVSESGRITANAEGFASVSVRVLMDGRSTFFATSVSVEVKEPWITTGPSLTHYFGNGGLVTFPDTLAITDIGQFAFSNYDYVPKTEMDEISDEDPTATKMWFLGEDTIEEIIIPEGVKTIGAYAFANLTALKKITLPSTLESIDKGAFYGCTSLTTVEGLEYVKFINQYAFENCNLTGDISLDSAVAVANYAFAGNKSLKSVTLSEKTRTLAAYAFAGNTSLTKVTIPGDSIQLGQFVFTACSSLTEISLNTAIIPYGAFYECTALKKVSLGKDVAVISEFAFGKTGVTSFTVASDSPYMKSFGEYILNAAGDTLILVAPAKDGVFKLNDDKVTTIGQGAFSGNERITGIEIPSVTRVETAAFADCVRLASVKLSPALSYIGDSAYMDTAITSLPDLASLDYLGSYAFANTQITSVTIPAGFVLGEGVFYNCTALRSVSIGNGAVIGKGAFSIDSMSHYAVSSEMIDGEKLYYYSYVSPLTSLSVGDNVVLGDRAFYGAASLAAVTLGKGVTIGDYAFYNAASLASIDLSQVTFIGDYAFSGDILYYYISSAMKTPVIKDNAYLYRYYSPVFTSVTLSDVTELGVQSFAHCRRLGTVTLGEMLYEVPERAFLGCAALAEINLGGVTVVGLEAFAEAALVRIDLSSATSLGNYAFVYNRSLTAVTLSTDGARLGEGVFAYCDVLSSVDNLGASPYVGDYAMAYTAITSADLTAAEYVGTHAFIKETVTDFIVTLGSALTSLGDNPFALCRLPAFTYIKTESFNGKDYETVLTTYDVSDSVKVIDGSLYQTVPYGLELVTFAGDGARITVADDTVRIAAHAFSGADVVSVTLPYTVAAIGHKAFFDCNKLLLVVFQSYDAPILEEEYDVALYNSGEYIPATGVYELYDSDGNTIPTDGLGIVPYFMWNVAGLPTNVYYGASFIDYIGLIESPILMVRPSNGQCYDSFIWTQYFSEVTDGALAADDTTLAAIAAIAALPDNVTLTHKSLVLAARAAYAKIGSAEQRTLVTNYERLTTAEKRISDLEYLQNQGTEQEPVTPDVPKERMPAVQIVLIVLSSVFFAVAAAEGVYLILLYIKKKRA